MENTISLICIYDYEMNIQGVGHSNTVNTFEATADFGRLFWCARL